MSNSFYIDFSILILYLIVAAIVLLQIVGKSIFKSKSINRGFVVLFIILFIYICSTSFIMPVLKINGNKIVTINVFDEYKDEGVEILHYDKNIKIHTSNMVNTKKVGVYDVKYSIIYHNKLIEETRKVQVKDSEKPKIELIGDDEITITQNEEYIEPGYKSIDNYDGEITENVKVSSNIKDEIGEYEVIYSVSDSSGNEYSIKRKVTRIKSNSGVIYLTFDDGPSSTTTEVLDILKRENVKATFFVVNYSNKYEDVIKRIVNEGHTIAVHSYTHNYKYIYASEANYYEDLLKLREKIKNTTGIETNIIRFPGGSSNTVSMFNRGIMSRLTKSVKEKGYHYFDWNVDSRDAGGAKNSTEVYNNVMNSLKTKRNNVVLMHDFSNNKKTIEALEKIIKDSKQKGFTFSKITYNTPMVTHGIKN